jgi:hypothetical protein
MLPAYRARTGPSCRFRCRAAEPEAPKRNAVDRIRSTKRRRGRARSMNLRNRFWMKCLTSPAPNKSIRIRLDRRSRVFPPVRHHDRTVEAARIVIERDGERQRMSISALKMAAHKQSRVSANCSPGCPGGGIADCDPVERHTGNAGGCRQWCQARQAYRYHPFHRGWSPSTSPIPKRLPGTLDREATSLTELPALVGLRRPGSRFRDGAPRRPGNFSSG